MGNRCF